MLPPARVRARKAKRPEPIIAEAESILPDLPRIEPQQEVSAYRKTGQEITERAALAEIEKQRLQLERDRQDMGKIGTFFGKAWTPAAQVTAILLLIVTCVFVYTIGSDPERFSDLQKALLAFMSSGLAFLWGRVGK